MTTNVPLFPSMQTGRTVVVFPAYVCLCVCVCARVHRKANSTYDILWYPIGYPAVPTCAPIHTPEHPHTRTPTRQHQHLACERVEMYGSLIYKRVGPGTRGDGGSGGGGGGRRNALPGVQFLTRHITRAPMIHVIRERVMLFITPLSYI